MKEKELLTETELDQVTGGDGYLYFRDNGDSYDAFICTVPLNEQELNLLKSGQVPEIKRDSQKIRMNALTGVPKGEEAASILADLKEDYGKFNCILPY